MWGYLSQNTHRVLPHSPYRQTYTAWPKSLPDRFQDLTMWLNWLVTTLKCPLRYSLTEIFGDFFNGTSGKKIIFNLSSKTLFKYLFIWYTFIYTHTTWKVLSYQGWCWATLDVLNQRKNNYIFDPFQQSLRSRCLAKLEDRQWKNKGKELSYYHLN